MVERSSCYSLIPMLAEAFLIFTAKEIIDINTKAV